jgi:hypothetical protein
VTSVTTRAPHATHRATQTACMSKFPYEIVYCEVRPDFFDVEVHLNKARIDKNISINFASHPKVAMITHFGIETALQGKGHGTRLLLRLEQEAKKRGCVTIRVIPRSNRVTFYTKRGYKKEKCWSYLSKSLDSEAPSSERNALLEPELKQSKGYSLRVNTDKVQAKNTTSPSHLSSSSSSSSPSSSSSSSCSSSSKPKKNARLALSALGDREYRDVPDLSTSGKGCEKCIPYKPPEAGVVEPEACLWYALELERSAPASSPRRTSTIKLMLSTQNSGGVMCVACSPLLIIRHVQVVC